MSRRSITLPQNASWDLVVTSSGVTILVLPHGLEASRVIAADDGLLLDGDRPTFLMGSERAVPYVRRETRLLLVHAGHGRRSDKVVPVVVHVGNARAGTHHGQHAAA